MIEITQQQAEALTISLPEVNSELRGDYNWETKLRLETHSGVLLIFIGSQTEPTRIISAGGDVIKE